MSQVLAVALGVFVAVALSVAACSIRPAWRRHIVVAAPVTLGLASLVGAWLLLSDVALISGAGGTSLAVAWTLGGAAANPWVTAGVLVACGLAARAAFRAESLILRWVNRMKKPRSGALPAELLALNLPERAETMSEVGRTAARPGRYWSVSLLAVAGEESLFRVAMPVVLVLLGFPVWVAIVVPAALYAVNHIGFGLASVLGKLLFGVVLGCGAWAAGALFVSAPIHLLYQSWVRRQFVSRKPGRPARIKETVE
ncbi:MULTISPECIES: CPBP family intramembrane glutamic endopeptidase [unclassified Arthrobacter]|uniref:CPBP family intramembrane glutamic endopeptidase n=1 Tax=unclassified Arthrobacter TaxID=235627 RepID=UPI0014928896|nr:MULTISPECIES: CPBP family intramembrane glutamic endopeptidase [unclassified Arthrobacter]MBE0010093.1 hypothetical protein [Arthrobacter sp. AET 35A]NOJ63972.1 CPBP family intramembrane metalloprotease [Arthrobacter sp. 147(2020)]